MTFESTIGEEGSQEREGEGGRARWVIAKWPSNLDLRNAILACVRSPDTNRFFLFLTPPVEYCGGASVWDACPESPASLIVRSDGHDFSEISLEMYEVCEETLLRLRINVACEKIPSLASAVYK